jgi:hypothetical protein
MSPWWSHNAESDDVSPEEEALLLSWGFHEVRRLPGLWRRGNTGEEYTTLQALQWIRDEEERKEDD